MTCIKRRARDKDGNAIAPMTLGNMRQHGIERVEVSCAVAGCGYTKSVAVSTWPAEVAGFRYRTETSMPAVRSARARQQAGLELV